MRIACSGLIALFALCFSSAHAQVEAQDAAPQWSLAIHGGAGVIERASLTPEQDAAYRAALKATDRLVVRMAARVGGAGGWLHWQKYRERKQPMPVAIVLGTAPVVFFTGPQKLPLDMDEMSVAGALAGARMFRRCSGAVDCRALRNRAGCACAGLPDAPDSPDRAFDRRRWRRPRCRAWRPNHRDGRFHPPGG